MKKYFAILFLFFTINLVNAQTKHVLLEELTGSWCHWCPGGTHYLDSLLKVYPDLIGVSIHTSDDMANSTYSTACGLTAAPSANFDRGGQAAQIASWFSNVSSAFNNSPLAGIDVFTHFDSNTRLLTVRVKATFTTAISGNYRLAAIITEDGVTGPSPQYNQSNSTYSGLGSGVMGGFGSLPSSIPAFMISYNHVGRDLLGGYNGQSGSIPASVSAGDTASYVFTYTIPTSWKENYISVIGLLIKPDNTIDNVGKSPYLDGLTNAKPLFMSQPLTIAYVGSPYLFDVYASDPDNDNLTISAINLPSWITMSPNFNLGMIHTKVTLSGIPASVGNYPLKIMVSDGLRSDTLSYIITVNSNFSGNWLVAGTQGFTDIGNNLGIVADKNGVLYAFIDYNNICNVYQKTSAGNWVNYGNLNASGSAGRIRMGSDGLTPYVAYLDPPGPAVVKKYSSGSWVQIGTSPANGVQLGFDLDANDKPYIAIEDAGFGYKGNCYTYNGTTWTRLGNIAYSGSATSVWNDLVVDKSNGDVYVLWANYSNGKIPIVSKWDGSSWSNLGGASISTDEVNYFQNLVIDKNTHQLYVSYAKNSAGTDLLEAYKYDGSSWVSIGSDIANGPVDQVSMAINDAGALLVAFVDFNHSSSVSAMSYLNGNWSYIGPAGFSNALSDNITITSYQNMPYVMCQDGAALNKATVRYYNFPIGIDEDINIINSFSIYPNPASESIIIDVADKQNLNLSLYNLVGELILQRRLSSNKNSIDISSLRPGMYIIQVTGLNWAAQQKIIKE